MASVILYGVRDPHSFLLFHCVWPWANWQPPSPGLWGRGRFTDIVTFHMATLSCMGGWGERSSLYTAMCQLKIRVLLPQRNESRFWGQPIVSATCSKCFGVWGWSQLFMQFLHHYSSPHWITSSICRARESFPIYHYVRFVRVSWTVLVSSLVLNSP